MSIADVIKFEGFNLKGIASKIKDNPLRLLYGGIDPASTKVWNTALGKDDEPLVDQWGGASSDTYDKAEAAGIDTTSGKKMHGIARAIAASFVGKYGAGKLGVTGSGPGGEGGDQPGGGNPMELVNQLSSMAPQEQQPPPQLQQDEVQFDADGTPYIASSKKLKTPAAGGVAALIQRGAAGEDQIDQNGVQIAAIQALSQRYDALIKRAEQMQRNPQ